MARRAYTERMAPRVKIAMGVMSDVLETACGWAFIAVALYAMLFLNLTGNGTLWDSLRGVVADAGPAPILQRSRVVTRVVPVRPLDDLEVKTRAQNRMLLIPNEPEKEFKVPVLAQPQSGRGADQFTDAPADAGAGTNWQKHLTGSLRTFTVYGNGEQRGSASASAGAGPGAPTVHAAAPAATAAADVSAYHAGLAAAARPGVSDHVSHVDGGAGDGVRNFR
jgi:hypothetical protein